MPDFIKTVVFHPGTGFFAADPPCAIHNDLFVFMLLHHLNRFRQLFTESVGRNFHRILEVAHFIFVVVTHIDEHCIRIVEHRVHFSGLEVLPHIRGIEARIVDAIRHNTLTHLHAQHPERFAVIIQRNVQA